PHADGDPRFHRVGVGGERGLDLRFDLEVAGLGGPMRNEEGLDPDHIRGGARDPYCFRSGGRARWDHAAEDHYALATPDLEAAGAWHRRGEQARLDRGFALRIRCLGRTRAEV